MPRRTIKGTFRHEYGGFCGWQELQKTVKNMRGEQTLNLFVGLFQTGARAMELPTLRKNQVDLYYSDAVIMVNTMYVQKQREKILLEDEDGNPIYDEKGKRAFRLESKEGYRTFPIRKDNPLAKEFMDYVDGYKGSGVLYPYSYNQMYYRISGIGMNIPVEKSKADWCYYKGPWWMHRIRAERACQLIKDYRYDIFRLKKWFGWATSQMPELYGDMVPTDLIDAMDREVKWR